MAHSCLLIAVSTLQRQEHPIHRGKQHRLAVPLLQRTERAFSAMIRQMRGLADIHLDVRGGDIIVDLPGTSYTVTYHKPAVSPQLLAAYLPGENDPRTELTQAEFLARAGRLANEKARELDWIV